MNKLRFLFLTGILSLLAAGCRPGGGSPVYDVVVVGGGPAGIGAALAAAETGARTALVERDSRIGGTTVQAEVCDMGLFYAWRRPIIAAARRCDPRDVPLDLVKKRLTGIGHLVPQQ